MISAREALRNQRGNTMIGTLVGSIVSLFLIGAIGSGIVLIITVQTKVARSTELTGQATAADAALRSDVRFASVITPAGDRALSLTVPGESGRCRTVEWSVREALGDTQLVRTVNQFPEYDATVNPVTCRGTPSAAEVTVMAKSVDPVTSFGYFNAGGRALTFTGGALVPAGAGTRPVSVLSSTWDSSALSSVGLSGVIGYRTAVPRSIWILQGAPSLSSVVGPADMASHNVGEKSLRAG